MVSVDSSFVVLIDLCCEIYYGSFIQRTSGDSR